MFICVCEEVGCCGVGRKGRHFNHASKTGRVTLPHPTRDVSFGELRDAAGVS
jgi:predicted RNA binding protein YcfA (HicA-like mRNA interferase family)